MSDGGFSRVSGTSAPEVDPGAEGSRTPRSGVRPRSRRAIPYATALAIVLLASFLIAVRWTTNARHAAGDTFWYTRLALMYAGDTSSVATERAARYIVDVTSGSDPSPWVELAATIDPRYPAIFAGRPLFPAVAAVFVPLLGPSAIVVAAFLGGIALAVVLGFAAYAMTRSSLAALAAVVLAYALPSGQWFAFLYADGWMLALWAAALACASAYLYSRDRRWLTAFAVALIALGLTKSANAAVLVVAVAGVVAANAIVEAWSRTGAGRRSRRSIRPARWDALVPLVIVALVVGLGQLVAWSVLGAPGLIDTLQDYFTRHYAVPDVADPVRMLIRRDVTLAPRLAAGLLLDPLGLLLLIVGVLPLLAIRRTWTVLWVAAAFSSVLTVLVHPVLSEVPRLLAPVWITASLGGGIGAAHAARAIGRWRATTAHPGGMAGAR